MFDFPVTGVPKYFPSQVSKYYLPFQISFCTATFLRNLPQVLHTTMSPAPTENGLVALETTQVKPAVVSGTSVTEDRAIAADGDEVAKVGMECDIKHLYQKEDERGRFTWTDKYPENLDEAAENEITARYAILVRNKKSFDSRKKLEIDSIVVQSPLLKSVLSKVLKDYPGRYPQSSLISTF